MDKPSASKKQAKATLLERATAPKPAPPTRAACRAADAIRARGGVVTAEFALLPVGGRLPDLPAFLARVQTICAEEESALAEAERGRGVVLAAGRQMERALARLAAETPPAPRPVKRPPRDPRRAPRPPS